MKATLSLKCTVSRIKRVVVSFVKKCAANVFTAMANFNVGNIGQVPDVMRPSVNLISLEMDGNRPLSQTMSARLLTIFYFLC